MCAVVTFWVGAVGVRLFGLFPARKGDDDSGRRNHRAGRKEIMGRGQCRASSLHRIP